MYKILRKINAASLPDRFSIKSADDLIKDVGRSGATIFTTIDLRSSFWQMSLAEKARKYTAFTILGDGQFHWARAPQVSSAPYRVHTNKTHQHTQLFLNRVSVVVPVPSHASFRWP